MKYPGGVDILIVDDRVDGLLALQAALDMPSINLVQASSGHEALNLLDNHEFAVILLDVQMPELDGFETAALIRQKEKYKLTPIIFVTAINKDERYVYRGYEVGAVDYVFKPFDPQVLRFKVGVFIDLFVRDQQLKQQAELIRDSERLERFQKLAELEIESLKRYRNLADSIPHIVWKAKSDGIFDYFNQVWLDYTGFSHEQSVGLGWQSAVHNEDLLPFLKAWIFSMSSNDAFQNEVRFRRHDGEYRWHLVRAIPEMQGERVVAWIGTCTDIHDKKLAEAKLIATERMAVSANVAKTSFLANMSHEIRTPMTAILGFSELMLRSKQTDSERTHCLETVIRSGRQLLGIIDEILDISKVEAGRLEIEEVSFNLVSLLSDLRALMDVQARSKNLTLDFQLKSSIPEYILSDPTRIRQILVNIVGNAIKFTGSGKVIVETCWHANRLKFRVVDTGVGISHENINKLFQPFTQLDSSTTRKFGGTGLGLFLSRQLAQAMGGDIVLEKSDSQTGTIFVVEVMAQADLEKKFVTELKKLRGEKRIMDIEESNNDLNGIKILLVEDSLDNQDIISYFLTSAGAIVEVADNGEVGVDKALAGSFDLVLMDVQMPQLDGYQATTKLREAGFKRPIVALTAHALREERSRCLRAGCNEHMTKPIDRNLLVRQVARLARQEEGLDRV